PSRPAPEPALNWSLARDGGQWVLEVNNRGQRYAQIADLRLIDGDGRPVARLAGLVGYALGLRTRRWQLPAEQAASPPVRIRALINGTPAIITPRMD
ncbi:fimbrial biogenesis chaperone, partial [Ralstonia pseudosolanacearum]